MHFILSYWQFFDPGVEKRARWDNDIEIVQIIVSYRSLLVCVHCQTGLILFHSLYFMRYIVFKSSLKW
jgi:hypothetical protein